MIKKYIIFGENTSGKGKNQIWRGGILIRRLIGGLLMVVLTM